MSLVQRIITRHIPATNASYSSLSSLKNDQRTLLQVAADHRPTQSRKRSVIHSIAGEIDNGTHTSNGCPDSDEVLFFSLGFLASPAWGLPGSAQAVKRMQSGEP